jgi:mono/diheme cytochrome c family protein
MTTRLRIAGVVLGWLVASSLGVNARLDAQERAALVAQGRQLFADKGCYGCHTVGATGTPIGPDLRKAAVRYGEGALARWLRDPGAQEPTRHMPQLEMSEVEARALAAFLGSLR